MRKGAEPGHGHRARSRGRLRTAAVPAADGGFHTAPGICLEVQLGRPEGSGKRRRDAAGRRRPLHRPLIHPGIERRRESRLLDPGRHHFSDRTAIEIEPADFRAGGGRRGLATSSYDGNTPAAFPRFSVESGSRWYRAVHPPSAGHSQGMVPVSPRSPPAPRPRSAGASAFAKRRSAVTRVPPMRWASAGYTQSWTDRSSTSARRTTSPDGPDRRSRSARGRPRPSPARLRVAAGWPARPVPGQIRRRRSRWPAPRCPTRP